LSSEVGRNIDYCIEALNSANAAMRADGMHVSELSDISTAIRDQ
jgi:hypothetical protein